MRLRHSSRPPQSHDARRRGATLVELAIAAPVLILITLGLLEFGYAFMVQHLMQNAAREGCRVAVIPRSTNTSVLNTINQSLETKGIRGASSTILVNNVASDVSQAGAGDIIRIQITVPVTSISIVPRGYLTRSLTASYTRRHE